MPPQTTTYERVWRVTNDGREEREDSVVIEEPLAIRINGALACVSMRTPGADRELAIGFLRAEQVLSNADDVVHVATDTGADGVDSIDVRLAESAASSFAASRRATIATSSCGLCGVVDVNRLLDDVPTVASSERAHEGFIDASTLLALPERMRAHQVAFDRTGGLHAAALVELDVSGESQRHDPTIAVCREDVGRHNAVDKVIGWATLGRVPWFARAVLVVSGRTSFEIVQKAAVAGVPVVVSVSAPSSLAVDCARRAGITLVGFVRGRSMNVYTFQDRVRSG